MQTTRTILSADELPQAIEQLADALLARHPQAESLAILGIQRRGADLAERLRATLVRRLDRLVPLGKLDINLYRDDWTSLNLQPQIQCTEIPFALEGTTIVLVDDVLYTGRTIRAALEAILDFGRPKRVELMVLVDRGGRELPIQPDYVAVKIATESSDHVNVYVRERDQRDGVELLRG